jgi:spore maturation protein B
MSLISKLMIPIFVISVIIYGCKKKIAIYDSFLDGAKDGLITAFNIFPSVIAFVFAINIFLNSGILETIFAFLTPTLEKINLPIEILPMAFVRPISGTASLAIMNDLFLKFGPDSFVGRLASTIQGCTDTTIYVLALYFGSVKITKTRYALSTGLFADFIGIIASFIIVRLFF